jgi:hypothetical protein
MVCLGVARVAPFVNIVRGLFMIKIGIRQIKELLKLYMS